MYYLLALLAACGFLLSVFANLLSWIRISISDSLMLLHLGIFVVWIPMVIALSKGGPNGKIKFEQLFAIYPKWIKTLLGFLVAFGIFNFIYFIYQTQQYQKHKVPFWLEVRGFSGHWMMFYGVATLGLIGLQRIRRKAAMSLDSGDSNNPDPPAL